MRAAIAAGADGIVTSSPDPGSLVEVVAEANEAGIPIININTPDPTANFDSYVGGDLQVVGGFLGLGRRFGGAVVGIDRIRARDAILPDRHGQAHDEREHG